MNEDLTVAIGLEEGTIKDRPSGITVEWQRQCRKAVSQEKRQHTVDEAEHLLKEVPDHLAKMVNLAAEKGASSWLTALPIDEHGFYLQKTAFCDANCLRYGWMPEQLPDKGTCGSQFSVEHALMCSHSGFKFLRHNEIGELTAKLLTEVCPNVRTKPELYTATNGRDSVVRHHQSTRQCETGHPSTRLLGRAALGHILPCKGVQPPCAQQPPYLPTRLLLEA